jgi:general secretion pathway protein A
MYQTYFGLVAAPFSIAPDPRDLYMSHRHQEALATLLYGLGSDGGFVLLTGEVGAGKTTICRCVLEQLPEACDVAYLFNPKLTVTELLSTVCDEFGVAYPEGTTSIKLFVDLINKYLLAAHAEGRRAVLIIDEAQNLSVEVLEQVRLLTNLETNERKLLQILLLGQPELVTMLARPELRQLAQRIVARYHLMPLDKAEVAAYVKHRLEVAGAHRALFPDTLWGQLYQLSGGVPRVINVLCDRALLGAFVQRKPVVDRETLDQAAHEVLPSRPKEPMAARPRVLGGAMLALGGVLVAAVYQQQQPDSPPTAAQEVAPPRLAAPANAPAKAPVEAGRTKKAQAAPAMLQPPPDVPSAQSQQVAFATLFNQWRLTYDGGQDPCTQALQHGLQCRTSRGGLEELHALNIPVILHLVDGGGHPFYAVLTGLGAKGATFSFGAQARSVTLDAVGLQWAGDYTMLLRMPRETGEQIEWGEHGPAAAWLGEQLAHLEGRAAAAPEAAVFDDVLKNRVKKFQLTHGLIPDGVAGFKTLARLAVAADPSAPRLSTPERRKK